jgi:hypothetical protein
VIFVNRLIPSKSIISLFNGTSMLYISNPYFPGKFQYDTEKDDILKPAKSDKHGFRLKSPRVCIDTDGKGFNPFYILAWSNGPKKTSDDHKTFYIYRPSDYVVDALESKINVKLNVSTSRSDVRPEREDEIMCIIDYQLCFATEILLIARLFNINLANINEEDNAVFLKKFVELLQRAIYSNVVAEKAKSEKFSLELLPQYVDSFLNPPPFKRFGDLWAPVDPKNIEDTQPYFPSMLQSLKKFMRITGSKFPIEKLLLPIMTMFENCLLVPMFKTIAYPRGEEFHTKFDAKITIWTNSAKTQGTKIQTAPKISIPCSQIELVRLWGGIQTNVKLKKNCIHKGSIFFRPPQLDYKFYKTGQPNSVWSVDKICTQRQETSMENDYDIETDIFGRDDDYSGAGLMLDKELEDLNK